VNNPSYRTARDRRAVTGTTNFDSPYGTQMAAGDRPIPLVIMVLFSSAASWPAWTGGGVK